jgi:hypothetical protein
MPSDFAPHDLTGAGTHQPYLISASSQFGGFESYHAFDGITTGAGSYWLGTNGGVDWLQLDTGTGFSYLLDNYSVRVNTIPEPSRAPKNWTLKGSNDGRTWTVLDTQTNQTAWTSGEIRNFSTSSIVIYYRFFRLDITANNGDATFTQVGEFYLFGTQATLSDFAPHNMTASNAPSPYVASASSEFSFNFAYKGFNGVIAAAGSANEWMGQNGGVDWLKIDFGTGNAYLLDSYDLISTNETTRAPKNWTMEGSNDGSTWTTIDTQTNETAWSTFESRPYFCSPPTTAYRYFRLNITANNGDATYTQVAELYLYGTSAGAGVVAQPQINVMF